MVNIESDPARPNWYRITTSSGNIYDGMYLPNQNYQTTTNIPPAQGYPAPALLPGGLSERTCAMLCHLSALAFWLGPLICWLIWKDSSEFVDDQGKQSLNFQISLFIYYAIAGILCLILVGFVLLAALYVFHLIEIIMAAIQANDGKRFRYPLTINFIR